MNITNNDLIGIYLFLKKNELQLDQRLERLMIKIEKLLFSTLSIEEFENLEHYYNQGISLSVEGE
jgi:hypothetical protein